MSEKRKKKYPCLKSNINVKKNDKASQCSLCDYVIFRPIPQSGIIKIGQWITSQSFSEIYNAETAHDKASILQNMIITALDTYLPKKTIKVTSDDKPWITSEVKQIDRQRKCEYYKKKKSQKWLELDKKFKLKSKKAKHSYYTNIVKDLKKSQPRQWYSKLKRMSSINSEKSERIIVQSMQSLSDHTQAEEIADQFAKISNTYEPLTNDKIPKHIYETNEKFDPIEPYTGYNLIKSMKVNASTVEGDIPMKLVK